MMPCHGSTLSWNCPEEAGLSGWEGEMTYPTAGAGLLVIIGVETKGRGLRVMLRDPTGF